MSSDGSCDGKGKERAHPTGTHKKGSLKAKTEPRRYQGPVEGRWIAAIGDHADHPEYSIHHGSAGLWIGKVYRTEGVSPEFVTVEWCNFDQGTHGEECMFYFPDPRDIGDRLKTWAVLQWDIPVRHGGEGRYHLALTEVQTLLEKLRKLLPLVAIVGECSSGQSGPEVWIARVFLPAQKDGKLCGSYLEARGGTTTTLATRCLEYRASSKEMDEDNTMVICWDVPYTEEGTKGYRFSNDVIGRLQESLKAEVAARQTLDRGVEAMNGGHFDVALELFNTAEKTLVSSKADVYLNRACLFVKQGRVDLAIPQLKTAIELEIPWSAVTDDEDLRPLREIPEARHLFVKPQRPRAAIPPPPTPAGAAAQSAASSSPRAPPKRTSDGAAPPRKRLAKRTAAPPTDVRLATANQSSSSSSSSESSSSSSDEEPARPVPVAAAAAQKAASKPPPSKPAPIHQQSSTNYPIAQSSSSNGRQGPPTSSSPGTTSGPSRPVAAASSSNLSHPPLNPPGLPSPAPKPAPSLTPAPIPVPAVAPVPAPTPARLLTPAPVLVPALAPVPKPAPTTAVTLSPEADAALPLNPADWNRVWNLPAKRLAVGWRFIPPLVDVKQFLAIGRPIFRGEVSDPIRIVFTQSQRLLLAQRNMRLFLGAYSVSDRRFIFWNIFTFILVNRKKIPRDTFKPASATKVKHHGPLLVDLTLAGFNLAEAMRTNPCLELAFERDMANWQSVTQLDAGSYPVEHIVLCAGYQQTPDEFLAARLADIPTCLFRPSTVQEGDMECTDGLVNLNLTDPYSFGRIDIPVRGPGCKHIACFDLKWLLDRSISHKLSFEWYCVECRQARPGLMVDREVQELLARYPKKKELKINGFLLGPGKTLVDAVVPDPEPQILSL